MFHSTAQIASSLQKLLIPTSFAVCLMGMATRGAVAQDLYFTNALGNTISKISPTTGPTTFASGLGNVAGITFDSSGNLYAIITGAAFTPSGSVIKITPDGVQTTIATGIEGPVGIALDSSGNIYTESSTNFSGSAEILKISPSGNITNFATGGSNGALAFDANGNLYEDYSLGVGAFVEEISPQGVVHNFAQLNGAGPMGMAFDANGNLFVATFSNVIDKIDPSGTVSTFLATGLDAPVGLTFDASGNLYVANRTNSPINTPSGGYILSVTPQGAAAVIYHNLNAPAWIAFDTADSSASSAAPEPNSLALLTPILGISAAFILSSVTARRKRSF